MQWQVGSRPTRAAVAVSRAGVFGTPAGGLDQPVEIQFVDRARGVTDEAGAGTVAASHFDLDRGGPLAAQEFAAVGDRGLADGPLDDGRFVVSQDRLEQPPRGIRVEASESRVVNVDRREWRLAWVGQRGRRLGGGSPRRRHCQPDRAVELTRAAAAGAVGAGAPSVAHSDQDLTGASPVAVEGRDVQARSAAPALQPHDLGVVGRRPPHRRGDLFPDAIERTQARLGLLACAPAPALRSISARVPSGSPLRGSRIRRRSTIRHEICLS